MTKIYNKQPNKVKRQTLRQQMPTAELLLWDKLRCRQVAGVKFRRQYGVEQFVLDFYCPELKLAIEVDGPTHESIETQEYDQLRQESIEALNIQFLRFKNEDIYNNINSVLDSIHQKVLTIQSNQA